MRKTLTLLLITSALFASAQAKKKAPLKYWEELTEKEKTSVLNDSTPTKNIATLYNNKYNLGVIKEDEALLKSLTSVSGSLVALRVFLFNKLISAADTSIKKLLQEYAVKMTFNQPDVLFRDFSKEHAKKKDFYKTYIPFFAADMDEKIEYQNWKDFLDLYFFGANVEIKQMLVLIYKECEKAGAGSKNPIPIPLPPKDKDD